MTTKILEAQLIINAQDKTAKGLEGVVKRVDSVIKTIDDFRKAQSKFADARGNFSKAQKSVEAAAKAMAAVEKPTRAMESAYASAQRAVSQASRAFEAQKSALIGVKHELESAGVEVTRLTTAQKRLMQASEQATAMQARQASAAARWQRVKTGAGAAGLYLGNETKQVARETIIATAEGAHERVRMEAAGMSPAEIKEAEDVSAQLSGKYKSVGQTKILHLLRNARSIVGHFDEAAQIIEPLLQTYVVAQGAHPQHAEELEADFDKLVKGMEIKGVTQDLPKFKHYLDNMSKALNVYGDTLRPTDYYEMFKYGRAATNALSDEFMLEVAPTFAQEMGGSSAGKAMSTFYGTIVGGKMKDVAAKRFVELGLADPSKIVRTKTGAVKGLLPNGFATGRLAAENPYEWVHQVLLPALAEKGITDSKDIQDQIATLFRDSTAAQMVSVMATQRPRIEKDRELMRGAKGSEAAATFQSKDPYIAMKSVKEQFNNLLQAAGSPLAESAALGLNRIASGLAALTHAASENPNAASQGLLATLGGGAMATWSSALGLAARFGVIAPGTASAGLAMNLPATILGAYLFAAWNNAKLMHDDPKAFQPLLDNPFAGMMEGDLAVAQAVMHPQPQEMKITVEVAPAEGFWAKVTSIWRTPSSSASATGSTGSVGKSMPEASPGYNDGMPSP